MSNRIIDGWELKVEDGVLVATWTAYPVVTAQLSSNGESIYVTDRTRYYPGGEYVIPFTVVDALRRQE